MGIFWEDSRGAGSLRWAGNRLVGGVLVSRRGQARGQQLERASWFERWRGQRERRGGVSVGL